MGINDWNEDERPRERLLKLGWQALSPAEVLAVLLGTGRKGESAVDLARYLHDYFGGPNGLCNASNDDILKIPGIGQAKLAKIRAVDAYTGLRFADEAKTLPTLCMPDKVYKLINCYVEDRGREEAWGILLDIHKKLIKVVSLRNGSLGGIHIDPREVAKIVLKNRAANLILAHNHPSGNLLPSDADKAATKNIAEACALVNTALLDHLIIDADSYFSFSVAGLLPKIICPCG